MKKSAEVTIFTDGSSRGNPGPGGWGSVVVQVESRKSQVKSESQKAVQAHASDSSRKEDDAHVTELGGHEARTTNNRMELMAAIGGLKHTPFDAAATVLTDSKYLINGITKWVRGWKRNGWKTKTKDDVLNKDLWLELSDLAEGRDIAWKYVGGHVGIVGNERSDHIATDLADGMKIKLYKGPLSGYDLPNILDESHDAGLATAKKSDSARSRAKAYSYVSSVGGVIEVHHSWPECEKRVKGMRGARYKKALDALDELKIIDEFSEI